MPDGRGDDVQRPRRAEDGSRRKPRRAACRSSTPPARWSPRCTTRASATSRKGRTLILIGHAGHPEVEGTMGQIAGPVTLVQTRGRRGARHCRRRARRPTSPRRR